MSFRNFEGFVWLGLCVCMCVGGGCGGYFLFFVSVFFKTSENIELYKARVKGYLEEDGVTPSKQLHQCLLQSIMEVALTNAVSWSPTSN